MVVDPLISILAKNGGNLRTYSAALLLVGSCLVVILPFPAGAELTGENNAVGVAVGDWTKYIIQGGFMHQQGRNWAKVEVMDVSGTNVTVRVLGGEYPWNETVSGNVADGVRGGAGIFGSKIPLILPRDFNINSVNESFVQSFGFPFPTTWNFTWDVETLTRKYGETPREVNLLIVTYRQYFFESEVEWHDEFYWDKATGVILETWYAFYYTDNGSYALAQQSVESIRVSETSLWQTSQSFNSGLATLIAIIVAPSAFGAGALAVKNWKNRRLGRENRTK